jgi:hypothetical protein
MSGKLTRIYFITLFIFLFAVPSLAKYSGGNGQPGTPYLISSPNDLNSIGLDANDWDKHFKMTADIDLTGYTGTQFNIIGNLSNKFRGVFDGNNHTISNFTYTSAGTDNIGIFGYASGAEIKNVGLINPNVSSESGTARIGSLIGGFSGGSVIGCYVEGGSVSGGDDVGGLTGGVHSGVISHCYATASVSGSDGFVGGLAGYNGGGAISNCYTSATCSGIVNVGGLVGQLYNDGNIYECYSTGVTQGWYSVGGLVGSCFFANTTHNTIYNCYATGQVTKLHECALTDGIGGLVGLISDPMIIMNCYSTATVSPSVPCAGGLIGSDWEGSTSASFWDTETSGQSSSSGGTGLTTAQMKTRSNFTDAGWDFVNETTNGSDDIWTIHNGVDYAKMTWQLVNYTGWHDVDGQDYAYFADRWKDDNCGSSNDCDGTDLDFSDVVDIRDLKIFCAHWLEGM